MAIRRNTHFPVGKKPLNTLNRPNSVRRFANLAVDQWFELPQFPDRRMMRIPKKMAIFFSIPSPGSRGRHGAVLRD